MDDGPALASMQVQQINGQLVTLDAWTQQVASLVITLTSTAGLTNVLGRATDYARQTLNLLRSAMRDSRRQLEEQALPVSHRQRWARATQIPAVLA